MRQIEGDLIALAQEGRFDVIVHGCNCFCSMGAGIAAAIRQTFPEAWEADRVTEAGDRGKLGTITTAEIGDLTVVNAYTQYRPGGGGVLADYDAIEACFREIARRWPDARIGYPKIGAGLAGGDWDQIAPRIDRALDGPDHTLVVLPPKGTA